MEENKGIVRRFLLTALVTFIVGVVLVVGVSLYNKYKPEKPKQEGKDEVVKKETVSPTLIKSESTPALTLTPSPTTTESVSEYKVQILNGTGEPGVAKLVRGKLSEASFSDFLLGNAESFEYKDTEVRLKTAVPKDVFQKIKSQLIDYTVVEKEKLSDDSEYDIIIIIGVKKTN